MAIKSAYELAMERLGKSSAQKLTGKQKAKLAELNRLYTAKIAQVELDLKPKIVTARAAEKFEEAEKLEETLRAEIQKLRGKLEAGKEKIRQGETT
jgi:predicted kinase